MIFLPLVFALGAHAETDCTAAAPTALIDAKSGKDHTFEKDKKTENAAHETVTLADGTKLRIDFEGCMDVAEKVLTFTFAKDKHGANDVSYWAGRAEKALDEAAFTKDEASFKTQFVKFLKKAPSLPNAKKDGADVSECMDGSRPTPDGCSFDHLGLSGLKVSRAGTGASVVLTWSDNL